MKYFFIIYILLPSLVLGQADQRIESEYKLDVPLNKQDDLWAFLKSSAFLQSINPEDSLEISISIEDFVDVYYDNKNDTLYKQLVGLRYRSRYKQDTLLKRLVQLKTPINKEGVARNEIKYEIKKSTDKNDFFARHDLLKYIKKGDRKDINYQLAKFGTNSNDIIIKHTLKQKRKRLYIFDSLGALATLTLDQVMNNAFPYQKYSEIELELNEQRYTDADVATRNEMEAYNKKIKQSLSTSFPILQQDQTPKYNKMKNIIDKSMVSKLYQYRMWLILSGLFLMAIYLWIKNEN